MLHIVHFHMRFRASLYILGWGTGHKMKPSQPDLLIQSHEGRRWAVYKTKESLIVSSGRRRQTEHNRRYRFYILHYISVHQWEMVKLSLRLYPPCYIANGKTIRM